MHLLLDTNVWSYFADHEAGEDLARTARAAGVRVAVSPVTVEEVRRIGKTEVRQRLLRLVAREGWLRLMPEAYSECVEVKSEIKRLRPGWVLPSPKLAEINRLRYDWVRRVGGYWDRAARDVTPAKTDESERAARKLQLAREESSAIRRHIATEKLHGEQTDLRLVAGIPEGTATIGWDGNPVEYWRVPSLHLFRTELLVYTSPAREWLDSEIEVAAMLAEPASMNRLWLSEMSATAVPRQWLRRAMEFLQAWRTVTPGTPGDCSLATHLVEVDDFITTDKNFANFGQRCRTEAPFRTATVSWIPGGRNGVDEALRAIAGAT